jgi:Helix-turn-helix domain
LSTNAHSEEERKAERLERRQSLEVGDDFRPYDLFDDIGVIPLELLRFKDLSGDEKAVWIALARFKGATGAAWPSMATLGETIGRNARQARRLAAGLEKKGFIRREARFVSGKSESDTNIFSLLFHDVFVFKGTDNSSAGADNMTVGTDDLTAPGTDNSSAGYGQYDRLKEELNHHHQKKTEKKNSNKERSSAAGEETHSIKPKTKKARKASLSDDDEIALRAPLSDPKEEFIQRIRERHLGLDAEVIYLGIPEPVRGDSVVFLKFLEFDKQKTTAKLTNPGGYYRKLATDFQKFLVAQQAEQRARERQTLIPKIETVEPCPFGRCNGKGELNDAIGPCECEAGKALQLNPKYMATIQALLGCPSNGSGVTSPATKTNGVVERSDGFDTEECQLCFGKGEHLRDEVEQDPLNQRWRKAQRESLYEPCRCRAAKEMAGVS